MPSSVKRAKAISRTSGSNEVAEYSAGTQKSSAFPVATPSLPTYCANSMAASGKSAG